MRNPCVGVQAQFFFFFLLSRDKSQITAGPRASVDKFGAPAEGAVAGAEFSGPV